MTDLALPLADRPAVTELTLPHIVADVSVLTWRNLVKFSRNYRLMVLSTIQPLTQLVLFAFVFNQVATVPGVSYKQFVVPGVLIQTVVISAMRTGVAVSDDLDTGMMDRFRSLPIARSAVLVGRTVSDTTRIALQTLLIFALSATLIGFHFTGGPVHAAGAFLVVVGFGMALTAFSGWVGLSVDDPETAQTSLMVPVLPLVFLSSAFAPVNRLPTWMQPVARYNPVTSAVDLSRSLSIGGPLVTPFERFVVWTVAITVTFTTLGVRRYRNV
jgi:ABC-2 type transport system permease protein/oleandomycin transport system permease protein